MLYPVGNGKRNMETFSKGNGGIRCLFKQFSDGFFQGTCCKGESLEPMNKPRSLLTLQRRKDGNIAYREKGLNALEA